MLDYAWLAGWAGEKDLGCQRLGEVCNQVVCVLEADRDTQQIFRCGGVRAFNGSTMLNQAFDRAKAGCACKKLHPCRHADGGSASAMHLHRQHSTERLHLADSHRMARMVGKARVVHTSHPRMVG